MAVVRNRVRPGCGRAALATPLAVLIGDHDEVTPLDQVDEWKAILQTKTEVRSRERVAPPTQLLATDDVSHLV